MLSICSSECDGALTPVAEFVARVKALKASPASEIVMAAFAGPVELTMWLDEPGAEAAEE